MYPPPRQTLAYATVSFFLVFMFLYGAGDSLMVRPSTDYKRPNDAAAELSTSHPDFSNYIALRKLKAGDFPFKDPKRRIIIIGDLHGMSKPFHKLLNHLNYKPPKDVLIHVGDIVVKGSHKGSLAVLDYMSLHNITGVRGNHDQKVIEWRAWIDWISLKKGGKEWLQTIEDRWHDSRSVRNLDDKRVESWLESLQTSTDKKWLKHVPKGWVLFSDHYKVAKDMSDEGYRYLLGLPLCLYIPSAHAFIVHAGLLPSNPSYEVDDKNKQPLARMPTLPKHSKGNTIESLRHMQEIGILTEVPQNMDPWVVLNMRSVVGDKVSRKTKGKSWSKLWNRQMESCVGYHTKLEARSSVSISENNDEDWEENESTGDMEDSTAKDKKLELPCYPSTTIYGHAAARGLDIKRWSIGLDSGCVYDEELTALVLGGVSTYQNDLEERGNSSTEKNREIPFGDAGIARIVAVGC